MPTLGFFFRKERLDNPRILYFQGSWAQVDYLIQPVEPRWLPKNETISVADKVSKKVLTFWDSSSERQHLTTGSVIGLLVNPRKPFV